MTDMSSVYRLPARVILLGLLAVSLTSACQNVPWISSPSAQNTTPGAQSSNDKSAQGPATEEDSTDLLEYANGLLSLDPEQLGEEFQRTRERFSTSNDPGDRMRMVILLLEPDSPFRDLERARKLLEDYLGDPESYDDGLGYRDMALFLLNFTEPVYQAGASESKLRRQLDSERLRRKSLARRLELVELELATVRAERRTLQKQVEALKNIEETLRTRERLNDERPKQ